VSRSRSAAAAVAALLLLGVGASAAATAGPPTGAQLAALAQPPARTAIASDRIYFLLTDRYANGDPANDRGGRSGARAVTGYDPADTGWYHGGDLRGLTGDCADPTRGLARIKALGFTAIWITPPFGQRWVQGSSAAYHGYWIQDFTTVDRHLGTEADFAAMVGCAHRLGLRVYLDVVVNHTADVISPSGGSAWVGPDQVPYRDCRGRAFDPARFTGARPFPCLRAATMPRPPFVLPGDRAAKRPAWLNDPRRYHNRGDVDFGSCSQLCYEQGEIFGLDDLFTEQAAVVNGLAAVYGSWITRFKVDGFRIDTARHVDRAFFGRWVPRIRAAARAAGVRDFELFGEVFVPDAVEVSGYVRDRGLPNALDFPLQDALVRFAGGDAPARGIAARLGDDDYFRTASGLAPNPPTFLGNHDMGRAAQQISSHAPGASAAELLRRDLLGHDLLYLLRGAPVVLYGDEVGMIGSGGDKAAREDMFKTDVSEWRTEPRAGSPPIGAGSSFDVAAHPVAERLKALAALRDAHPALAVGASTVRLSSGRLLAVSRFDAAARHEYVTLFNGGTAAASATVQTATPSSGWTALLGSAGGASSGADGRLRVALPPLSTAVLRAEAEVTASPPPVPVLRAGPDDLTELVRLSAAAGSAPLTVSFAVRRGSGAWRRLAADDSPPYRAFLEPSRYRRGERVSVVAIARGLDGRVAVSKVSSVLARPR
jgi:glycosidase